MPDSLLCLAELFYDVLYVIVADDPVKSNFVSAACEMIILFFFCFFGVLTMKNCTDISF